MISRVVVGVVSICSVGVFSAHRHGPSNVGHRRIDRFGGLVLARIEQMSVFVERGRDVGMADTTS